MEIMALAEQINEVAAAHLLGSLQDLRGRIRGKRSRANKIFSKATIMDNYSFHDGGRSELQFNVGLEMRKGRRFWRHGVAFSFQKSQTLPDPSVLRHWVRPFNVWVESNTDELRDFRMWHERKDQPPSEDRRPCQISELELQQFIKDENFVFLGARVAESNVNVDQILHDLDRLYPLYEYCLMESLNPSPPKRASQRQVGSARQTKATLPGGEIDVDLRHNLLQEALVSWLKAEFHSHRVQPELEVANGCRVDVAVETKEGPVFCEIKVAPHAREAIRHAFGQFLEYTHWPAVQRAKKWWVISESVPTADDLSYLQALRTNYALPVFYRSIDAATGSLGPEV